MSYVLQVALRIRTENIDAFMSKVLDNAAQARKEPGCRRFDVLVDPKDPAHAMLYEVYDNEAAFVAHQATDHFKRYLAEAVPLLESRERIVWTLAG
jgi:autoinducer 2-degrading protein